MAQANISYPPRTTKPMSGAEAAHYRAKVEAANLVEKGAHRVMGVLATVAERDPMPWAGRRSLGRAAGANRHHRRCVENAERRGLVKSIKVDGCYRYQLTPKGKLVHHYLTR